MMTRPEVLPALVVAIKLLAAPISARRFRGLLAAILSAWAVSLPAAAAPLPTSAVIQDLTYFRDVWAAKDRSFSPQAHDRLVAFIDGEIARAAPMERADLALVFSQAEAFSGNDHTQSDFFAEPDLFHGLPISFWLFPEGGVVTRAHPTERDLLGATILSIGGVPLAEAEHRVAKYISGTAERHRFLTPTWLTRMEVLQAVGLAHEGHASFAFRLAGGQLMTRDLGVAPSADPAAASPTWRQSMVPGKGPDPWPHILERLPSLPLYVMPPTELAAQPLEDGRALYIRSNSLSPYTDDAFLVQIKAYSIIDDVVKSGRLPKDVIVDLRYNGGGNFLNITNFTTELAGLVGRDGHIYVITGRATNSAAIIFTALLKAATHGRTVIVGEEPSDNLWFWSEGQTLEAPASKLPLRYMTGYHDWAHGCRDLGRCYWPVVFHGVAVGSIAPDLPIEMTFADYAAGRDPAMEAILARIRHAPK